MEHPFLRCEMLWGEEAQQRLAQSHVILFGLGGVGSYVAESLVRAGIGEDVYKRQGANYHVQSRSCDSQ